MKQGKKISNFENASQKSYSFTFDYLQKNFEEELQKNLQKQNVEKHEKCRNGENNDTI